ncbi:MAG: PhoPQ-activated protein PqaA family protein [Candidatus Competibacterales bacterium]
MPTIRFCLLLAVAGATASLASAQTVLDDYVNRDDGVYAVERLDHDDDFFADTYFLKLTSLRWRTAAEVDRPVWEHLMVVVLPRFDRALCDPDARQTAILLVNGGSNPEERFDTDDDDSALARVMAEVFCSVVVELRQVPNQPLGFADEFGRERREDEILAYSMDRYLTTGDPDWPVQLAMAKAVVRAMDATQALADEEADAPIDDFVVLGGSKRGWTTWLAAAADPRVKIIVPISFDALNLGEQFRHHFGVYGFFAPAVREYDEFDLGCRLEDDRGAALLGIIDPFNYRDRFAGLPTLIINSTGDQFFVSDSAQFYFDSLSNDRFLRYTINTDHEQGGEEGLVPLVLEARAWLERVNEGDDAPEITWRREADGSLRVETSETPERVRLWQATNPNARDFRLETLGEAWTDTRLNPVEDNVYLAAVPPPPQGFTAFLVEVTFDESSLVGVGQVNTTEVFVTPDVKPFADQVCNATLNTLDGIWWNPRQQGQGIQLLHTPGQIAAAWYHYDPAGNSTWVNFTAPLMGPLTDTAQATGELRRFQGIGLGEPWDNAGITSEVVGEGTWQLRGPSSFELRYTLDGVEGVLNAVPFARTTTGSATGLWFDPSRNGQGVQLVEQNGQLQGAWYHYGSDGEPRWLSFVGQIVDGAVTAELLRFTGPQQGSPWDEDTLASTAAGTATLALAPEAIALRYTVDGIEGQLDLVPFRLTP